MTDHRFDSRREASLAAAARITDLLANRLKHQPRASLVVSGGTSPLDCFAALRETGLDWERVQVLLSDERWVAPDHVDSNEKLARESLLTGKASEAQLQAIYAEGLSPEERCDELQELLPVLPFSASLIGMGADGHFASLFPDSDNLEFGLAVDSGRLYMPVSTAASPHTRISMTLAGISRSDEIVLLFFGEDKLAVYEQARADTNGFPVSRLLRQKRAPVRVFWAP